MPAVCGKRSYFEDIPSPLSSKRIRCCSPLHLSSPPKIGHLCSVFPQVEADVLEKALEQCGSDLNSAINMVHQACSVPAEEVTEGLDVKGVQSDVTSQGEAIVANENLLSPGNLPSSGAEWVELLVSQMSTATSMDVAKGRASAILESLEKSITASATEEASQSLQKENLCMRQQIEVLVKENSVLKRAVAIQHERQKSQAGVNQEIQQLKQVASQYQEHIRNLEVKNYALAMHLRQAQEGSNPMFGRFNPDVC